MHSNYFELKVVLVYKYLYIFTKKFISTKEIKNRLKELIEIEDKNKPFTDEELSELLGKDEYHIARRTVSKYREILGLQTAKLRRKL